MTPTSRFYFVYVDPDAMTPTVTTTVPPPIGWKDATFSLTRDPNFKSLVEYFKSNFTWFGDAYDIIQLVKENEGVGGRIQVKIYLNYGTGSTLKFTGLLDLSQTNEIARGGTFYKVECPIIRDDTWARFMSRRDIPVNLQATTDLDGDARTAVNKFTLPLPCQLIRKQLVGVHQDDVEYLLTSSNIYGALDCKLVTANEIPDKNVLERVVSSSLPGSLFTIKQAGEMTFTWDISLSTGIGSGGGIGVNQVSNIEVYIRKNSDSPTAFTKTNLGVNGADGRTRFSISTSINVVANDEIRIYIENTSGGNNTVYWLDFYTSVLTVYHESEFQDTTTDAYLLKDAFESVLSKIVGDDSVLTSSLLDTCVGKIATMRGKHVRGYSFSSKAFFVSFDELWSAFHPLGFAGLGYTDSGGFEIESIEDFYDVDVVVFISNASITPKKPDPNLIFKKVEVGFAKWSAESGSGIDDIQTSSTYNSNLKTVGTDLQIKSSAYMAGLGIEEARRQVSSLNKDYKLDEDLIFIAVKDDGSGGYEPEVGTDFDLVTGITNSDTRYNLRHNPAQMLKRWERWIMRQYYNLTGGYKFAKGEGNYDYTIEFDLSDCETNPGYPEIDGTADLDYDGSLISKLDQFTITCAMSRDTYDAINNNRKKGIAVSSGTSAYKVYFIEDLQWSYNKGKAVIDARLFNDTTQEPELAILMEDGNYILQEDSTKIILE